jgi:hypothetical protein
MHIVFSLLTLAKLVNTRSKTFANVSCKEHDMHDWLTDWLITHVMYRNKLWVNVIGKNSGWTLSEQTLSFQIDHVKSILNSVSVNQGTTQHMFTSTETEVPLYEYYIVSKWTSIAGSWYVHLFMFIYEPYS